MYIYKLMQQLTPYPLVTLNSDKDICEQSSYPLLD